MTNPDTTVPRFRGGYRGFLAFAACLKHDLPPFQRKIARAAFGSEREVAAILSRGHGKSTLAALIAMHHLATHPDASVAIGSTSRGQASIVHEIIDGFADHPALAGNLKILAVQGDRPAIRWEGTGAALRIVSGRGERAHGRTDSLMIIDEMWAIANPKNPTGGILEAFQTALIKRPDARLLVISTPAASMDTPLGRMRARALAGSVTRKGPMVEATANGLRWLEWSTTDDVALDDYRAISRANPAPWITVASLREQAGRLTPAAFAQFHAGRWGAGEGQWLPPGAWAACRKTDLAPPDGCDVWLGVDIGGARSASAVVAVTADLDVAAVRVLQGDAAVLGITDAILDIAQRFTVREVAYDPMRFHGEAHRLERDHRLTVVDFPQSHARMTKASETLHAAIVEQRLAHPGHADLDRHIAAAIAKPTGRGWRLHKAGENDQIDAAIALAMAVDRASAPRSKTAFLGWL